MFFLPCKNLTVLERDHPVEIFRMPWLMGDHDDSLTEILLKNLGKNVIPVDG
jgi:hypothetical protein